MIKLTVSLHYIPIMAPWTWTWSWQIVSRIWSKFCDRLAAIAE